MSQEVVEKSRLCCSRQSTRVERRPAHLIVNLGIAHAASDFVNGVPLEANIFAALAPALLGLGMGVLDADVNLGFLGGARLLAAQLKPTRHAQTCNVFSSRRDVSSEP